MIDLGRAFKAPFEDKDWVTKTLMGFVWGLLVVTSPAVIGAQLEYIRGVSRSDERLPAWDDFGKKWVDGFLVAIAGMLYFLPVIIVALTVFVPATIVSVSSGESSDGLAALFAGGACLFVVLAMIYSIAVSVLFNAAVTHFAVRGNFGAFFEFGTILAKVRGGTGYFTAWLYALVIGIAASAASSVLYATVVGGILYPAIAYLAAMMTGHVLGQWAARAYGAAPLAPATEGFGPPIEGTYTPSAAPAPPAPPASPAPPAPPASPAPPAPPTPPVTPPEPSQPTSPSGDDGLSPQAPSNSER